MCHPVSVFVNCTYSRSLTLLSGSNPLGIANQNECMHSVPVSMGVPTVGFWMTIPQGFIMEQSMQPMPPSFVPNYMSAYSDRMTFLQRVHNFIWKIMVKLIGDFHINGMQLYEPLSSTA